MKSASNKGKKQVGLPVKTQIKAGNMIVGSNDDRGTKADIEVFG